MDPNVLGDIDYFDQIDDLINFPLDDESGCCNNLLLTGSTVDCKDFPIYMADDALIPDDCEPLLCRGRIDRSMPDVDLSAALFVPFEDIVRPEWDLTIVSDAPSGDDSFQKETTILSGSSSSSSSGSNSTCSDEKAKIPLEPYRWGPQQARTKRPRPKNPYDPKSTVNRLVMMISPSPSASSLDAGREHTEKKVTKKIKTNDSMRDHEVITRKCLHCEITTTPQWRAGPMGPKTLCNACGVRYKSGRLYPEYRPAASPTFVSSLHSNSHKKVLEMRSKVGCGIEANDANDATIEMNRD